MSGDVIQEIRDLTPHARLMILAKLLETADDDLEIVIDEIARGERDATDIAPLINALINLPLKIQAKIAKRLISWDLGLANEQQ
jgi:hypothetical protein